MVKEINQEQVVVLDNQEGVIPSTAEDMISRKDEYKNWIKMSQEEMVLAQENEILIGYNPEKGLGLVKFKETRKK